MADMHDIYDIYKKCFPNLPTSYESFKDLLSVEDCILFDKVIDGISVGAALVRENSILLLCVLPEYRNRGIGSGLLLSCEKNIRENGYQGAVLGEDNWFFLGAPLCEKEWEKKSSDFFSKRGYKFDGGCLEMSMKASEVDPALIPEPSVKTEFRFLKSSEHEALIEAVAKVDKDWCRYFTEDEIVFAGISDRKIFSFCMVEENCRTLITDEGKNIGSIGCVGTVPEMRGKGIGLSMVGKAAVILRDRGADDIYIHYTYLDKWYGKLGFKTIMYFGFGEKHFVC